MKLLSRLIPFFRSEVLQRMTTEQFQVHAPDQNQSLELLLHAPLPKLLAEI